MWGKHRLGLVPQSVIHLILWNGMFGDDGRLSSQIYMLYVDQPQLDHPKRGYNKVDSWYAKLQVCKGILPLKLGFRKAIIRGETGMNNRGCCHDEHEQNYSPAPADMFSTVAVARPKRRQRSSSCCLARCRGTVERDTGDSVVARVLQANANGGKR